MDINQSEQSNAQSNHRRHSRIEVWLKVALAATGLFVLISAGWVVSRSTLDKVDTQAASAALRQAVTVDKAGASDATVKSKLGFAVTFNQKLIDIDAKVITGDSTADVFTGQDALKTNSYAIVDLVVKKEAINGSGLGMTFSPSLAVLTNANRDFFARQRAKTPGNITDEQIVINHYLPKGGDGVATQLIAQVAEKVGAITYQKLTYQMVRSEYPNSPQTQIQYITVQNGRPFALAISYFAGTKQGDLAPLLKVVNDMKYSAPDPSAQYLTKADTATALLASERSYSIGHLASQADTLNTPEALAADADINLVAKNQLAVIRVGAVNCFDLTLRLTDGSVAMHAPEACSAGVGSGSIITKDGYVITNGHVVEGAQKSALMLYIELALTAGDPEPLKQYTAFLVDAKLIKPSEAALIKKLVPTGDTTAFQAFSATFEKLPAGRLTSAKQTREYAIQLSNEPLKMTLDGTHISLKKTSTVVAATLIGDDYDPNADLSRDATTSSDVALLKMSSHLKFPVVALGSVSGLEANDGLTVVGFPAFVDGGLVTKMAHTIPTATQGKVDEVRTIGKYWLVYTSVPIAEGNSGGPAFDAQGKQIGLATYVVLSASDPEVGVSKLGTYSILRDVADAKALASKYGVTPAGSQVSDNWHAGVDEFSKGNYAAALGYFKKTSADYPGNYLVGDLMAQAGAVTGEASRAILIPLIMVVAGSIAFIVCVALFILHQRRRPPTYIQPLHPQGIM